MKAIASLIALLSVLVVVGGCGGNTPTRPSDTITVIMRLQGAPFSVRVDGGTSTYSADGQFSLTLNEGAHELSGSYTDRLIVAFGGASVYPGGVLSGSVRKVTGGGNLDALGPCGGGFTSYPARAGTIRLSFTVTTDRLAACQ